MSRSYRKQPFMAITGNSSAKKDKQLAHRGERRTHRHVIACTMKDGDFEEFVAPIRKECCHNNIYSWNRDGRQRYQSPTRKDWEDYLNGEGTWPPMWYLSIMRK